MSQHLFIQWFIILFTSSLIVNQLPQLKLCWWIDSLTGLSEQSLFKYGQRFPGSRPSMVDHFFRWSLWNRNICFVLILAIIFILLSDFAISCINCVSLHSLGEVLSFSAGGTIGYKCLMVLHDLFCIGNELKSTLCLSRKNCLYYWAWGLLFC